MDLPRLAQMELKVNQFNVTTRRHSQGQLAEFLNQADHWVLTFRLQDRFADHGLVSSLVAVREGDAIRIDNWLLSCRVFGRGAESFILAALATFARNQGATALLGEFIAGRRNGVVEQLYSRLGFQGSSGDGRWWRRELDVPLDDLTSFIAETVSTL